MKNMTNLWRFLQAECDRSALLRACGVCEDTIQNGSDYDRFSAYADCMLLCRGHEILQADAALIKKLLGVAVPICTQNAPSLWHASAFALTGQGEVPAQPEVCDIPFIAPAQDALCAVDLGQARYAAPTAELLTMASNAQAVSVLVSLDAFARPNPYAARQLCQKSGDALTMQERDLLTAQTLRVLGKICAERDLPLYIRADFAATDAWRTLLVYLHESQCLPRTVLLIDGADALRNAAKLVGCVPNQTDIPRLRVGVSDGEGVLDLYATLLPIGVLPPQI